MKKLLLLLCLFGGLNQATAQVTGYGWKDTCYAKYDVTDFTYTDTDGNTINLDSVAASGKWIFIDFFFTTCPTCQASAPIFSEVHEKYGCNTGDLFCVAFSQFDYDQELIDFENNVAASTGFKPAPAVSLDGNAEAAANNFAPGRYPTLALIDSNMVMRVLDMPAFSVQYIEDQFANVGFAPVIKECTPTSIEKVNIFEGVATITPNPASAGTQLNFTLETPSTLSISIVDILGSKVSTQDYQAHSGKNSVTLDTESLPSGLYMTTINSPETGSVISTKLNVIH